MSPTGIDQSWGYADPAKAKAAGVQVVAMYLSWDPSKNATASKIKAYHRVGIAWLPNWESESGAPLKGGSQGQADATEAVRQVRALISQLGYQPGSRLTIYFSCDQEVNSSQWGAIDSYYRAAGAVCHSAGFGVGAYGQASLVHQLAGAGITDGDWQTCAWSGGVIDPAADFYQSSINNTLGGASVDFDQVIHPAELGAWWPPGSTYDNGGLTVADINDLMSALRSVASDVKWTRDWVYMLYWGDKSHPNALNAQGAAMAQVLTRVAALQAELDQLKAGIKMEPTTVPVTGSVVIGGTK